ncbi:MAG: hypothetical protein AAGA57_02485 [Planctomycetota bacterium]
MAVSWLALVLVVCGGSAIAPPPMDLPFKAARKAAVAVTANLYLSRSAQMPAMAEREDRQGEAASAAEVEAAGEAPFVIVGEEFEAEELESESAPEPATATGEDAP